MTRQYSADLAGIVTGGSFTRELVGDVYYGGVRLLENVPIEDWSLAGDLDANIKTTAKVRIVYQDDFAAAYTPREATDAFAAYGQELHLFMVISAGDFTERVRCGIYRIDEVPDAYDRSVQLDGRTLTTGSVIDLDLVDRFDNVNWPTRSLVQPLALTSAWGELIRVSRLQATRTVADAPIPNSIVYPRNRLETVQQIAGILGGRALMRSDGTVGVVPDALGSPVITLRTGEPDGTIIGTGYSMISRQIANVVIGDFEDDAGRAIHAEAAITTGPLDVAGPFGERVVEYPNDQKQFVRTQAAANAAVKAHLERVSQRGPIEIPVTLTPDPRLEVGDVVELKRPDGDAVGRVVKYSLPRKGAMQLTVRAGG